MSKTKKAEPSQAAHLVEQFHEGRKNGRIVDVLDVFAQDAVLEDPRGGVHRGIREIAAAYAGDRSPVEFEVVSIKPTKDGMTATVRVRKPAAASRTYREIFGVARGRVRSLRVVPVSG